eukprot:2650155-Pleurochrysis_carterae.AAC.2
MRACGAEECWGCRKARPNKSVCEGSGEGRRVGARRESGGKSALRLHRGEDLVVLGLVRRRDGPGGR